jgi:hypothetical protein
MAIVDKKSLPNAQAKLRALTIQPKRAVSFSLLLAANKHINQHYLVIDAI